MAELLEGPAKSWSRSENQGRLGPMRSHQSELRPRGGPELCSWNDGHRRERVSLEPIPRLEKHVCAC